MAIKTLARFSPGRFITLALGMAIIIGTCLLALPASRNVPMHFLDILFTATSVTCVTGLTTVPLTDFTPLGHWVLLLLTQIGGLGLITLFIFFVSMSSNLAFATQLMAVKLFDLESWHNMKQLMKFIIGITLGFELVGAAIMLPTLLSTYSWCDALFLSFFHAVTCFCNAGITLFKGGMCFYNDNYVILITSILLIIAGGLGFLTWHELLHHIKARRLKKWHALSLTTKIILWSTLTLIVTGTIGIYLLESTHAFAHMTTVQALVNSLFQSVSARSAGLLTVPISSLSIATLFLMLGYAFIGAAPASTGSGVKITTAAVFLATVKAAIFGHTSAEIKGRSIANDQIYKAIAIISLGLFWILASTFIMLIIEPSMSFGSILLEIISAFTTLGISVGITSSLCCTSKILLIMTMIIGRIGSFTFVLALKELRSKKQGHGEFSYPEERVLLS